MNENLFYISGVLTYLSICLARKIIAWGYNPRSTLVESLFYCCCFLSLFLSFGIPAYYWYQAGFVKALVLLLTTMVIAGILEAIIIKEAAKIAPLFVLLIGVFQVYSIYAEFSKPETYTDCILKNMPGSGSNLAAAEIRRACRAITSK